MTIIHLVCLSESHSPSPCYSRCFLFFLVTLPLWDPSPVQVGAVGYLSKPQGRFVTLFNALTPDKATHAAVKSLPSILGYGPAQLGIHRQDRRSVTQKGMDAISGLLTFRTSSYVYLLLPSLLNT